ncbi:cilia- and flagella-associated protein 157-like [Photinus pyralis]|uniref:cilia- and flagella-associated protein 157-like n=1 Tax=Photinus pyralis TaxID=7054 RepID=UPI001267755B|nr:cilia- and flagella-associated protein 157-like [Photinus pyralis]
MPKAKKGGMVKNAKTPDISVATAVDKAFYELKIEDLNRRLARIRSLNEELENKNEELETRYKTLDEDRSDVISYLKRVMQDKVQENKDLNTRITQLEEARVQDDLNCKSVIKEMKADYKLLHEQLTSEIKMLNGKINSLDEFRQQKEELMKKFIAQEQALDEQEVRHKREMYDIEKKFVMGKDQLKRDMEARLMELSSDFQNVTEIRIAATTNRVVRENIAINNELNTMIDTHQRLYDENELLKESNKTFKLEAELHNTEKKKAVSRSSTQTKLICKITSEYEDMKRRLRKYKNIEADSIKLRSELGTLLKEKENRQFHICLLEQNLHASRCERGALKTELDYCKDELGRLTTILYESLMSIKVELMKKPTPTKRAAKAPNRETLLNNLIISMSRAKEEKPLHSSLESVESVSLLYSQGDLGLVPKPVVLRSKFPTRNHKEIQMGPSFETLLANYVPPVISQSEISEMDENVEEIAQSVTVDEFFIPKEVPETSEDEIEVFGESTELETASSSTTSVSEYEHVLRESHQISQAAAETVQIIQDEIETKEVDTVQLESDVEESGEGESGAEESGVKESDEASEEEFDIDDLENRL